MKIQKQNIKDKKPIAKIKKIVEKDIKIEKN